MEEQKKLRKNIVIIYATLLAAGFTYYVWGRLTGLYIPCLLNRTTGLLCPGCGTSRMFLSLAEGAFQQAFSYNPVVFVLLIFWNLVGILCFWGRPAFLRKKTFLYTGLYSSVAALVILGVIRNFP